MNSIPMLNLRGEYEFMKDDIDNAIKNCLEHQKWILGPEVKELENSIAQYLNVKHCVGVSSGTDALVLSLRALAIQKKGQEYFDKSDEIITTPFTFTATGDAILRSGATPVFIDIAPDTFNIDIEKIKQYLSKNNKAVGIIPVHLYGQSCRMDEIMDLARKYNLFVVEDVAQAFGAMWREKRVGSIGNAGAFSFFPSKNLGGFGDGGMISTNDDKIAELVRMLLKHGGRDKYNVDHIGYNARLDTLQAAILVAKMKHIKMFNENRQKIAKFYNNGLKNISDIIIPSTISEAVHVYHQYTIRVLNGKRDELQKHLKENGIDTMIYYPMPLHKMKVFEKTGRTETSCINAEQISKEVLSLPTEPLMKEDEINYIIETIKKFMKN